MKMLLVSSYHDYGASNFEEVFDEKDYLELWQDIEGEGRVVFEEKIGKKGLTERTVKFHVRAYEFGEVDPEFVDFVRQEIQDYDTSKHTNFYIIPE